MDSLRDISHVLLLVWRAPVRHLLRLADLRKEYSMLEILALQLGNSSVLETQRRVLKSGGRDGQEGLAMEFKKTSQEDNQMITIAATIFAQIAITALSMAGLSKTHWIARASLTFSLVSSIVAVYHAGNQYRGLGHCMTPGQVKAWIRGDGRQDSPTGATDGVLPGGTTIPPRHRRRQRHRHRPADTPSVAAVLSISAPGTLLSASVHSFIAGMGVYLGHVWTLNLDSDASDADSEAVFITFMVGLAVCYGVYTLSGIVVSIDSEAGGPAAARGGGAADGKDVASELERGTGDGGGGGGGSGSDNKGGGGGRQAKPRSQSTSPDEMSGDTIAEKPPPGLAGALREAARLRRELAAVDAVVADLLEAAAEKTGGGGMALSVDRPAERSRGQ